MKHIVFAAALSILVAAHAVAQPVADCATRVTVGGALGLLTLGLATDPTLAGVGRHGLATTTGTGLEGSVDFSVPIGSTWKVRAEFGSGTMAVKITRDEAGNDVDERTGDNMLLQRFTVGLMRTREQRMLCGYVGFTGGVYRYSYRGTSLNVGGGAVMMGFEGPKSGAVAFYGELGISVALTTLDPPTAAELATNIRPAFGFRYRF